jgi:hypothetical protein
MRKIIVLIQYWLITNIYFFLSGNHLAFYSKRDIKKGKKEEE